MKNNKREFLKDVFTSTSVNCIKTKKNYVKTKKISDSDWECPTTNSNNNKLFLNVVNDDCIRVAHILSSEGKTCILNMANAYSRGGGVLNGAMAQEEELCRRSSLWYGLRPSYYPLKPTDFIYSKNIKIFKDKDYKLIKAKNVDVITIAAPNMRDVILKTPEDIEEYTLLLKQKVKQMLFYPINRKCKNLILSAFGCGAFKNNPFFVADIFKEALSKYSHLLPYDRIIFSILDDKSAEENGFSNFSVFQKKILEK